MHREVPVELQSGGVREKPSHVRACLFISRAEGDEPPEHGGGHPEQGGEPPAVTVDAGLRDPPYPGKTERGEEEEEEEESE